MDMSSRLPGSSIELGPVFAFDEDMPSWDCGEEFLSAFDLVPEGLEVCHVENCEVCD